MARRGRAKAQLRELAKQGNLPGAAPGCQSSHRRKGPQAARRGNGPEAVRAGQTAPGAAAKGARQSASERRQTVTRRGLVAFAFIAAACATVPRPRVMGEVDAVRGGAAVKEAAKLAPQMHAKAELLRTRANRAHDDGKRAQAQVLSEHALAAYAHAAVLARLAKADQRLAKAKAELKKVQADLDDIDEKHKRVAAEAEALELRVKIARGRRAADSQHPCVS